MSDRSSYTIGNALRFKDIFDKAIATGQDVSIGIRDSGMSLGTLKHRCNEALLYLCREFNPMLFPDSIYKGEDYQRLRGCIRISLTPDGITLQFKNNRSITTPKIDSQLNEPKKGETPAKSKEWKDRVMDFLQSESMVLNIVNLRLSTEDQQWARDIFLNNGLEHLVKQDLIRATK